MKAWPAPPSGRGRSTRKARRGHGRRSKSCGGPARRRRRSGSPERPSPAASRGLERVDHLADVAAGTSSSANSTGARSGGAISAAAAIAGAPVVLVHERDQRGRVAGRAARDRRRSRPPAASATGSSPPTRVVFLVASGREAEDASAWRFPPSAGPRSGSSPDPPQPPEARAPAPQGRATPAARGSRARGRHPRRPR